VVERAVVMRRLPEAGMLPHLLERGEADAALMTRIAARLAAFHAAADSGPRVARHGGPTGVRRLVEGNLLRAEPYVGRTLDAATYAHLRAWTATFLQAQRPLLLRRRRAGRIREGHGDLHAANVCVDRGEPVLFDCIEFSPRLRCADVAAEVAFLAMDLAHHGRAHLAAAFVDAYVAASGDPELRALLPFYASYRATVRGLVASIAAAEPGRAAADRAAQAARANSYFDLARYAYAGGAPRPLLLLLGGLPASGKSTLARALAERLALVPLNSDVVRKQRAGLAPTARGGAGYGAGLYGPAATEATYAALVDAARAWLGRGVSVALDASFRQAAHRARAVAMAEALGVPWLAVECVCAPDVARARLAARARHATAVSDADRAIYTQLAREWEPWTELPAAHHRVVDTARGLETAVGAVLAAVSDLSQPPSPPE
jgi:aminoglycoside phosphotransferase family enzyme/predicted kinase